MPELNPTIILAVLGTLVVAFVLYRAWSAAKKQEPRALDALARAAFRAAEHEVSDLQTAAKAAQAEADAAAARLANLRAEVSGVSAPAAPSA